MSNLQETPSYRTREKDEQSIDIKSIVYIFLSHWYLFLICAAVALAAGWLYNRFSAPAYQVSGTVLIKENRSSLDPTSIMTNGSYGNSQNLDNEIAIMKSYSLRERDVKKMKMEVSY